MWVKVSLSLPFKIWDSPSLISLSWPVQQVLVLATVVQMHTDVVQMQLMLNCSGQQVTISPLAT